MAKFVRFKGGVILRHPETGAPFVPDDNPIEDTAPIVKANRWAFASDEELAEEQARPVEQATKRPGQKRSTKRS